MLFTTGIAIAAFVAGFVLGAWPAYWFGRIIELRRLHGIQS